MLSFKIYFYIVSVYASACNVRLLPRSGGGQFDPLVRFVGGHLGYCRLINPEASF